MITFKEIYVKETKIKKRKLNNLALDKYESILMPNFSLSLNIRSKPNG